MCLASCAPLGPLCILLAFVFENGTLAVFDDLATKRGKQSPDCASKDERKKAALSKASVKKRRSGTYKKLAAIFTAGRMGISEP